MATQENERKQDERLDASISVLGDEGKEPHVARVGPASVPQEKSSLEEELADGKAKPSQGNLDQTSQRAAKDSISDKVEDYGKP